MYTLKKLLMTMVGAAVIALEAASAAQAFILVGEDLSRLQDQPLTSTPNADYTRDQFLSFLSDFKTEDFEGFLPEASEPLTLSFGNTTATLTGGGQVRNQPLAGLYPISGQQYWSWTNSDHSGEQFSIEFSEAQTALGFYATDVGDTFGGSNLSLIFSLLDGSKREIFVGNSIATDRNIGASALYFGLFDADNPFTRVTFVSDREIGLDGFGFDDMTIGSVKPEDPETVPEPTSVLGVLAFGAFSVGSQLLGKKKSFRRHHS